MSTDLLEVRVERRDSETEDICSYELVSADGAPLPAFSAGAHIDVHVAPGLVRQYSLEIVTLIERVVTPGLKVSVPEANR